MSNYLKLAGFGFIFATAMLTSTTAEAASVLYNFGSDTGKVTTNASNSTAGVALTYAMVLNKTFANSLVITTNTGNLFCAVGATPGTCGSAAGLTTGTAYGLGVGDGRIDAGAGDVLTFTVQPGFVATLTSFVVTGFAGSENVLYSIDGGANVVNGAPVTNVAMDSFNGGGAVFHTLSFSAGNGGNYSLAQITFDLAAAPTPEPASIAMIAGGVAALAFLRRRQRTA